MRTTQATENAMCLSQQQSQLHSTAGNANCLWPSLAQTWLRSLVLLEVMFCTLVR